MFTNAKYGRVIVALAGLLAIAASGYTQTLTKTGDTGGILVQVNGLACSAAGPAGFHGLAFHVGMIAKPIDGASGAKAVFGDLTFTKSFDSCSQRLLLLALSQQHIQRVLITDFDKSNQPLMTVLLEDVVISANQVQHTADSANTTEELSLAYAKMTISDLSGTGGVVISR